MRTSRNAFKASMQYLIDCGSIRSSDVLERAIAYTFILQKEYVRLSDTVWLDTGRLLIE